MPCPTTTPRQRTIPTSAPSSPASRLRQPPTSRPGHSLRVSRTLTRLPAGSTTQAVGVIKGTLLATRDNTMLPSSVSGSLSMAHSGRASSPWVAMMSVFRAHARSARRLRRDYGCWTGCITGRGCVAGSWRWWLLGLRDIRLGDT